MDPFLIISALTSQSLSGTGITIYGSHLNITDASNILFHIDGDFMRAALNDTTSGDHVSLIYYSNNIGDGDHQLEWVSFNGNASVQIAYFELRGALATLYPKNLC